MISQRLYLIAKRHLRPMRENLVVREQVLRVAVLGSCTTFYLDTEIAFILFYEKANAILCLFLRNGGKRYSFMG